MKSAITALALITSMGAEAMTGNQFMEAVRLDGEHGTTILAYISGVGDMNAVNRAFKDETRVVSYCVPPGADNRQAAAIAIAAMRQNPDKWHGAALNLILPALARAWPCPVD